jgi:hypothetical protein
MAIRQTSAYKVDLKKYMSECEANYLRLSKLLPEDAAAVRYQLESPNNQQLNLKIAVLERCKYTTMISIEQCSAISAVADLHFECRIYHDVRMVEVMKFQRQKACYGSYIYPNRQMLQRDEKYQQHRFLSDCLSHCLGRGLNQKYAFAPS